MPTGSPYFDREPDSDGVIRLGTPLRDAAVDPRPGDHLPPTNAGEPGPFGNPHGPTVVAPGLPLWRKDDEGTRVEVDESGQPFVQTLADRLPPTLHSRAQLE